MKKIFQLLFLMALLPFLATGQITIEATQIKLVGNAGTQSRDTTPDGSILPGGTGSQSWDFSSLKDQARDSLAFFDAADTPYAAQFPGTNIASTFNSTAVIYFEKTNDYLRTPGSYGTLEYEGFTVTSSYRLSPAQTVIKFPMVLNGTNSEEIEATIQVQGSALGLPYDSIRAVTTTQRQVTVDAFGTLTTPSGVYETLRTTEIEISRDSAYILNLGNWIAIQGSEEPDTLIFYNWWTNQNGLGFPVVQLEQKTNGDRSAIWLFDFTSGTKLPQNLVEFSISPNPASDYLNVELPVAFSGSLEVFDMNGRSQLVSDVTEGLKNIDIQSLGNGSFVLVLKNTDGRLVCFERFAVVR